MYLRDRRVLGLPRHSCGCWCCGVVVAGEVVVLRGAGLVSSNGHVNDGAATKRSPAKWQARRCEIRGLRLQLNQEYEWITRSVSEFFHAAERAKNHREPEVPEVKVLAVECLDRLARITLEELVTTHFVENGTVQNACSARPRVVADLEKSAHSHIVRLMNSRRKGPKRMMTKVQWLN